MECQGAAVKWFVKERQAAASQEALSKSEAGFQTAFQADVGCTACTDRFWWDSSLVLSLCCCRDPAESCLELLSSETHRLKFTHTGDDCRDQLHCLADC